MQIFLTFAPRHLTASRREMYCPEKRFQDNTAEKINLVEPENICNFAVIIETCGVIANLLINNAI
jgi:hypothetical protein